MQIIIGSERKREVCFLVIVSSLFSLLRLPSVFEPYRSTDEAIYEVIGLALNQGKLLYRDIWDNKPPLLHYLYATFDADLPTIKCVNLLFGMLSVVVFFYLAKKLFHDQKVSMITTSIFAFLLATPLLEGNIANAENFMMPLILGAALLIFNNSQTYKSALETNTNFLHLLNNKYLILFFSGFLLGLAFLFKVVAVFDLGAFTLFLFFNHFKTIRHTPTQTLQLMPLFLGFIAPVVYVFLYFLANHALSDYIQAVFLSNIAYIEIHTRHLIPQSIQRLIFVTKFIPLTIFCLFCFRKRKDISAPNVFILLWLAFSIFNALFSQRAFAHYLLVLLPSFSLSFGFLFLKQKSRLMTFASFIPVICASFIFLIFLCLAGPPSTNLYDTQLQLHYYQNFINYVTKKEDTATYQAFFGTVGNYAVAEFLNRYSQKSDIVYIWGDDPVVYKLINKLPPGRFSMADTFVETALSETAQTLEKTKPKFIVITQVGKFPFSLLYYSKIATIDNVIIYERDSVTI